MAREEAEHIGEAALAIHERLRHGGKLILFGNGGSATDANDWAIDCVPRRRAIGRFPPCRSRWSRPTSPPSRTTSAPTSIFLRQLIAQAEPDDVAIAISTSGGSRNVIAALEEARKRRLLTVALLGYDGGEIRRQGLADHSVVVALATTSRASRKCRPPIYHIMRESLEELRP